MTPSIKSSRHFFVELGFPLLEKNAKINISDWLNEGSSGYNYNFENFEIGRPSLLNNKFILETGKL